MIIWQQLYQVLLNYFAFHETEGTLKSDIWFRAVVEFRRPDTAVLYNTNHMQEQNSIGNRLKFTDFSSSIFEQKT